MESEASTIEKTLEVNVRQWEFYNNPRKNSISRIWSYLRNIVLAEFRQNFDIKKRVYEEHMRWSGGVESMSVLDSGCPHGNYLSIYMAKNAREYLGVDLNDKGDRSSSVRQRRKISSIGPDLYRLCI